jgi:hypothetical protein
MEDFVELVCSIGIKLSNNIIIVSSKIDYFRLILY